LSPEQADMLALLVREGYSIDVAYSFDEGCTKITNYLKR
jgi:hypothetical protein